MLDMIAPVKLKQTLPAGYTDRPIRMEDIPTLVEMSNAWSQAVSSKDQFTEQTLYSDLTTPKFDLDRSTRAVFAPSGEAVAVVEFWDLDDPLVSFWVRFRVHPEHEGRGIGDYLMEWALNRAQDALPYCHPEAKILFQSGTPIDYEPLEKLFQAWDFEVTRSFYTMRIDLEAAPERPQIPEGFRLRPYHHPQDLREVIEAVEEAFQDHWGHVPNSNLDEYVAQVQHETDTDPDFDPNFWFIAEDTATGEIAGAALCFIKGYQDPDLAWVADLGVRRQYRKRGLAGFLLRHSFAEFWKHGRPNIGLGVDASNLTGALRLYKSVGMREYTQRAVYTKVIRDGVDMFKTEL